jgi:hypothetical protein
METQVDLGDALLTKIIDLVRSSDGDFIQKAKTLICAGKIGEMYLGAMADDCGDAALNS